MGKHTRWITTSCVAAALAVAAPGMAGAAASKYPVPKTSGGTGATKSAAKNAATAVQKTKASTLKSKGLSVPVTFTAAGKITVTVKGTGTAGTGSATAKKAGKATVKVKFSKAGKAGSKVTVTVVFKPSAKGGKSSTTKSTVALG